MEVWLMDDGFWMLDVEVIKDVEGWMDDDEEEEEEEEDDDDAVLVLVLLVVVVVVVTSEGYFPNFCGLKTLLFPKL